MGGHDTFLLKSFFVTICASVDPEHFVFVIELELGIPSVSVGDCIIRGDDSTGNDRAWFLIG